MKRFIWLPIAGFLLIAGATVAAAMPGLSSTAASLIGTQNTDEVSSTGVALKVAGAGSLLEEVLADLVTAGTITQEQSDAIVAALTTKADERRAEFEAQRAAMEAMRTQIQGFLEDGVISADEIAQLPADNPFANVQDILADGQVTLEELQSIGPFGGFGFDGPGRGEHGRGHHGPGTWFGGPDANDPGTDPATPDATSSPAATS